MFNKLLEYIDTVPVIDGHEHLLHPHHRVEENTGFFELLHYIQSDMVSSGMTEEKVDNPKQFLKYYQNIKNTTYGKMVKIFAKELYGVEELNEETIEKLDMEIKNKSSSIENAQEWYDFVFEKANITTALAVDDGKFSKHSVIKPIVYLDFLMRRSQINFFKKKNINSKNTFEDYLQYIQDYLDKCLKNGMLAGKFGTPYWRSLDIQDFDLAKAKEEYEGESEENPNFESYVFHYLLSTFTKYNLPIQFHTGHVEPSAADMKKYRNHWSNPSAFAKFAIKYPDLQFILLHTGFPYQNEYLSLVKNYQNIYADFSWVYIISPTLAGNTLKLALEMIPNNKIVGFGGDCIQIEAMYAHLRIAKNVIAATLSEMIDSGYLDFDEAKAIIIKILYDNPKRIYSLE